MFHSARLKLTAWYLLIIMLISIGFSLAIYNVLQLEFERIAHRQQRYLIEQQQVFPDDFSPPVDVRRIEPIPADPLALEETKNRLKLILLLINLGILGVSGLAGYFLAGRTLNPIKEMVDEQNRFITDASHELRTPLTSLKSEIEVNLRDNKMTLNEAKHLLVSNLEEVNNLQNLSDSLIQLTQYEKANGQIAFADLSIKSVLEEAIRKVSGLSKHKRIAIEDQVRDYNVYADKQSLVELFVILLDNAIKYSPKGKTVTLLTEKNDHSVVVKVVDQGVGISEEDLPRLFDRFYRADKSRTKINASGYGLGLSIAKQIIEKHNGSVKVESGLGRGTTFLILLPQRQSRDRINPKLAIS